MKIDPRELRHLTDTAVAEAQAEKRRLEAIAAEKERLRVETNKARADSILAGLPALARAAALKGDSSVAICRTTYDDHVKAGSEGLKTDSTPWFVLLGVQGTGLRVTLEHNWDDTNSWYDLTVHW